MTTFSCPAFRAIRASRPDSWKKLVFIWTPLLAKSGMMVPILVTNSTDTEGFATSSAWIWKSEDDLLSFSQHLRTLADSSASLSELWQMPLLIHATGIITVIWGRKAEASTFPRGSVHFPGLGRAWNNITLSTTGYKDNQGLHSLREQLGSLFVIVSQVEMVRDNTRW